MRVDVTDPGSRLPEADRAALVGWVESAVAALLARAGLPPSFEDLSALTGEVRVKLVDDAEMAAAHLEYCEIEGTTDVLTFDMSERSPAHAGTLEFDVDILACVDEAARQASARGHSLPRELLLYVIHGVLHCVGFDDHDEAGFEAMHAAEDRLLDAIGVGATFVRGATEGAP